MPFEGLLVPFLLERSSCPFWGDLRPSHAISWHDPRGVGLTSHHLSIIRIAAGKRTRERGNEKETSIRQGEKEPKVL